MRDGLYLMAAVGTALNFGVWMQSVSAGFMLLGLFACLWLLRIGGKEE
jgi:hypothetical protein